MFVKTKQGAWINTDFVVEAGRGVDEADWFILPASDQPFKVRMTTGAYREVDEAQFVDAIAPQSA